MSSARWFVRHAFVDSSQLIRVTVEMTDTKRTTSDQWISGEMAFKCEGVGLGKVGTALLLREGGLP